VKSPHNHISYALQAEALLRDFIPKLYQPLPTVAQMFQSIYDTLAQKYAYILDSSLKCDGWFNGRKFFGHGFGGSSPS
jgi:hypothetical protein